MTNPTATPRKIRTLEERIAAQKADLARLEAKQVERAAAAQKNTPTSKLVRAARLLRAAEKMLQGDAAQNAGFAAQKVEAIVTFLAESSFPTSD